MLGTDDHQRWLGCRVAISRSIRIDFMCMWCMCLDPVMKCCERNAITGGVVLSIMTTMGINDFDECHH